MTACVNCTSRHRMTLLSAPYWNSGSSTMVAFFLTAVMTAWNRSMGNRGRGRLAHVRRAMRTISWCSPGRQRKYTYASAFRAARSWSMLTVAGGTKDPHTRISASFIYSLYDTRVLKLACRTNAIEGAQGGCGSYRLPRAPGPHATWSTIAYREAVGFSGSITMFMDMSRHTANRSGNASFNSWNRLMASSNVSITLAGPRIDALMQPGNFKPKVVSAARLSASMVSPRDMLLAQSCPHSSVAAALRRRPTESLSTFTVPEPLAA
mmetsp:Transcript_33902/g.74163  ORF Transcript_33902/g.74163 Transcript_33902/m.74163 type:complete len:265 (+) Transcript_33902:101-895(+)